MREESMAPVPPQFVMGLNFSNDFQSSPVDPRKAVDDIAIHVYMAKTFSLSASSMEFIRAAAAHNLPLRLAVGTPNDMIRDFAAGNTAEFINKIRPIAQNICWICVGNEPLGSWYNGIYNDILAPAVINIHSALQNAGLTGIGVTVPQNFEFMSSSYPPSKGAIKPELTSVIKRTCEIMQKSGAPFLVNIYPFLTRIQNRKDVPLDYCLFKAPPNQWVRDGAYTYKNIFDAMIDALHVALGKVGFGSLQIVIGECGWPTAGDQDANPANAQTFNQNLIRHCKSGVGTPRIPNKSIGCFVFETYDEDEKDVGPGPFERYWGVLNPNGTKKYPLDWQS
jgi:exo-beta-1,3-glucanase (GH17 family)